MTGMSRSCRSISSRTAPSAVSTIFPTLRHLRQSGQKCQYPAGRWGCHEEQLIRRAEMAAGDTQITIAGNLVDDPELRFTPSGQPVAKFRVASTPRFLDKNTNEWKDGDSLFLTCNVWRQAAENVAESLTRGMRVIVSGRLRQRSYETKEGEKRTVYEVEVDDVGPSLRNASAKVNKVAGYDVEQAVPAQPAQLAQPAIGEGGREHAEAEPPAGHGERLGPAVEEDGRFGGPIDYVGP